MSDGAYLLLNLFDTKTISCFFSVNGKNYITQRNKDGYYYTTEAIKDSNYKGHRYIAKYD